MEGRESLDILQCTEDEHHGRRSHLYVFVRCCNYDAGLDELLHGGQRRKKREKREEVIAALLSLDNNKDRLLVPE